MTYHYSDPRRETDPFALPDIEVFYASKDDPDAAWEFDSGWYWWACFPGCLPDGEPTGPFTTEAAALADARKDGS